MGEGKAGTVDRITVNSNAIEMDVYQSIEKLPIAASLFFGFVYFRNPFVLALNHF
jgi:hypothetical protein